MKHTLITCALTSTILISPATFADVIEVDSKISKVTAYKSDGADIVRKASVTLPAGKHAVVFKSLPEYVAVEESVRDVFLSLPGVEIIDIQTKEVFVAPRKLPPDQPILVEIENITKQISQLERDLRSKDLQISFIEKASNSSDKNEVDSASSWSEKLALIEERYLSLLNDKATMEKTLKEKRDHLRELNGQVDKQKGAGKEVSDVYVTLKTPTTQSLEIDLLYQVENVSWSTALSAGYDSISGITELDLSAYIIQESGENWDGVELTLALTRPDSDEPKEIDAEFLSLRDPKLVRQRSITADNARGYLDEEVEEVVVTGSRIRSTQYDAGHEITQPVDMISREDAHLIPLQTFSFDVNDAVTRVSPRFDDRPFLYLSTEDSNTPAPIFNPLVELRRDGFYIGYSTWPNLFPGQSVDVPFGSDQSIKVDVQELPPRDGDTGIFSNKRVQESRHKFTIKNNNSRPTSVEVYDRIPASAHEDVKVTPLRGSTKPTENDVDGKPGVIKWVKTLGPDEVWEIHHEYRITYPEKLVLTRRSTR